MSKLGELMPVEAVSRLKLPEELISYFTKSSRIQNYLYRDALADVEEIFALYSSLYEIDNAQFSYLSIQALERATSLSSFYPYIKTIMESSLEKSKRKEDFIFIKKDKFERLREGAIKELISLVDLMYVGKEVDIRKVDVLFGQALFSLNIDNDPYIEELLSSATKVMNDYMNSDKSDGISKEVKIVN
ncbi:hypothetical protein [Paraliobacillus sp. X-1268]|uniref:hypothetical protein n=1 Tax=Paraliobacillus sp. X-1268 TaxID=2213193 RepID=UPI000E3B8287|nr:hypothetical protein [Paraliobacillus sp. X-1268]